MDVSVEESKQNGPTNIRRAAMRGRDRERYLYRGAHVWLHRKRTRFDQVVSRA